MLHAKPPRRRPPRRRDPHPRASSEPRPTANCAAQGERKRTAPRARFAGPVCTMHAAHGSNPSDVDSPKRGPRVSIPARQGDSGEQSHPARCAPTTRRARAYPHESVGRTDPMPQHCREENGRCVALVRSLPLPVGHSCALWPTFMLLPRRRVEQAGTPRGDASPPSGEGPLERPCCTR